MFDMFVKLPRARWPCPLKSRSIRTPLCSTFEKRRSTGFFSATSSVSPSAISGAGFRFREIRHVNLEVECFSRSHGQHLEIHVEHAHSKLVFVHVNIE